MDRMWVLGCLAEQTYPTSMDHLTQNCCESGEVSISIVWQGGYGNDRQGSLCPFQFHLVSSAA